MTQSQLLQIIKYLIKNHPASREELQTAVREAAAEFKLPSPPNWQLTEVYQKNVAAGKLPKQEWLAVLLRKRSIRTLSGIASVAVLTKPHPCPGTCAYCPTEEAVPKSYLSNEPAVMRAIANQYDPYSQVQTRLQMLTVNGHATDKIELIVMGGTWSYLPINYQYWFIKECFRAANDFRGRDRGLKIKSQKNKIVDIKKELIKQQQRNERAKNRIIGLTLETRPDYINFNEVARMRELGCTRVELGVQSVEEKILKLIKRGHGVKEVVEATELLKKNGFKICYHLMPNLPGSSVTKDLAMFKKIFSDSKFQPDMIKIYPCVVTKGSLLYRWFKQGKYKTYTNSQLINLLIKIKKIVPEYVRINRLYRDIPAASIVAGCKISNLRQVLENKVKCACVRCREVGLQRIGDEGPKSKIKLKLKTIEYQAGNGKEYFLQIVDQHNYLYAFLRLRLNNRLAGEVLPEIKSAALIRELHTYGQVVPLAVVGQVQHSGLGKKLICEAEKIAKKNEYQKIAVISGVGVRGYYKKLGYRLAGSYMVKDLPV